MNFSLSKFSKFVDLWKFIWFPVFLVCKNSILKGFKISKLTSKITEKIKFEHLSKLSLWIVFSLPFERIPSLNIGVNLRISQTLTLISLVFIVILILKKDRKILHLKIQKTFVWLVLFYFFAISSIFFVQNFGRFITTSIATFLAFCTCFLVAHFTQSVWQSLKYLLISTTISGIFGVFQFFGDFLNFPTALTGLRPQYTKAVFGYPRIQATAIEPLYFAGMLFLPLFFVILILLNQRICKEILLQEFVQSYTKLKDKIHKIFPKTKISSKNQAQIISKIKASKFFPNFTNFFQIFQSFKIPQFLFQIQKRLQITLQTKFQVYKVYSFKIFCWFFLVFFSFLFFFTLSKSGWLCFLIILFPLLFCYRNRLNYLFWQNFGKFILFLSFFLLICNFNPDFNRIFEGTLNHFIETFRGESGTISERNNFLQAAFETLPNYAIFGIGSGQFGTFAKVVLNASDNTLIVNNVYVEVWLEHGFLSLACFLTFLILPFWQYFSNLQQQKKLENEFTSNLNNDLNGNFIFNSIFTPNLETNFNIKRNNSQEIQNSNYVLPVQNNKNQEIKTLQNQGFTRIIGQVLCCTLLAFCLQWLTFSPIFINPIFIILGLFLAYNQTQQN